MDIQLGSLKLANWYKNAIINLCSRAGQLDDESKDCAYKSSNFVIPVLLFLFSLSFVIGGVNYLLYILIGSFISGCVGIPLILILGENYVDGDQKFDSRLTLFQDICIAWTNKDKFNIVRFGLFIISLISIFNLSLISTMMQKPIECTLHKFVMVGIESSGCSYGKANKETARLPSRQDIFNKYWYHKNKKQLSVDESYKLIEKWLTKDLGLTKDKIKERYNFSLSRESFPRLARNHMPY